MVGHDELGHDELQMTKILSDERNQRSLYARVISPLKKAKHNTIL